MKMDQYQTVLNHGQTFGAIATDLKIKSSIIFAWTDEVGTQLDILMALNPPQYGNLQRGMHTETDLFVAVSGCGMFGFDITNANWKSPDYIGEKLGLGGHNTTTAELAELINGVIKNLL